MHRKDTIFGVFCSPEKQLDLISDEEVKSLPVNRKRYHAMQTQFFEPELEDFARYM